MLLIGVKLLNVACEFKLQLLADEPIFIMPPLTRLVYMLFVDVVVGLVKLLLIKLWPIVFDAFEINIALVWFQTASFVTMAYLFKINKGLIIRASAFK